MAMCSSDNSNSMKTSSTIAEELSNPRKPKTKADPIHSSIMQSSRPKSSFRKYIKSPTLLGFGCTAQPQVCVPEVIRSSADWVDSKNDSNIGEMSMKKKKKKKKQGNKLHSVMNNLDDSVVVQDLWCAASSVDCVPPLSSRFKIDHNRQLVCFQNGSYSSRQRLNHEPFGGLDLDSAFDASHIGPDVFEARYYHNLRSRSPEGLAEIMMFQNGLAVGRRSGGLDRYRDWRLDVDSMTYEELIELGEKIGHVNTGLGEDQIGRCLRKTKLSVVDELSSQSCVQEAESKCSICQEEYEADDEMGKLECGHAYHLYCIKQWLARKNACPVCKGEAASRSDSNIC